MADELGISGFVMEQDEKYLKFGTDAMLLSEFAKIKKGASVCDLGCGSGAISILLAARHESINIHGVELVEGAAALAEKNARLNNISHRMKVHNADIRKVKELLDAGSFDVVVSNPPFMKVGDGISTEREALLIARTEVCCTIDDVCRAAAHLLKYGGSFSLVHRPSRLSEIFAALEKNNLAPKRMRLVQDTVSAEPSLVLLESRKGGGSGIKLLPALILKNPDGTETDETKRIYQR